MSKFSSPEEIRAFTRNALEGRDEQCVLHIALRAIACARADGAPVSSADEWKVRHYFARMRRFRATLCVAMWLAGTPCE